MFVGLDVHNVHKETIAAAVAGAGGGEAESLDICPNTPEAVRKRSRISATSPFRSWRPWINSSSFMVTA